MSSANPGTPRIESLPGFRPAGLNPGYAFSIQPLTVKRESRNCFDGMPTGITSCMTAAWKNTMLLCRGSMTWKESVAASLPLRIVSS